jgi:uncharacterized protein YukE
MSVEALEAAARRLDRCGDRIDEAASVVRRRAWARWEGPASRRFHDAHGRSDAALRAMADDARRIAAGLRQSAARLRAELEERARREAEERRRREEAEREERMARDEPANPATRPPARPVRAVR